MPLTKEDLQEIKLIMIETILEVVSPMVRKIVREEVPSLIKAEIARFERKFERKIDTKLKKLRAEMYKENHRMHQETRNYIFERMEMEYVSKYELSVQVERIDQIEKETKKSKN